MQATLDAPRTDTSRYARCIDASKRVRWDIDRDVIRGRVFAMHQKFLPDSLTLVAELPFLDAAQQRFFSQVQGRTYANMFGLIERYIGAKILELSRDHWFGDQIALEALVRFTDEELKHQELFRRVERLVAQHMPAGYRFDLQPNDVAAFVLGKSTWSVLALTCHVELFTQTHYRASIDGADDVSDLYKDVFLFHWKEESQHAILDELEWMREDAKIDAAARDAAVDDLIALVAGVDGMLQQQAEADAAYFDATMRIEDAAQRRRIGETLLKAYRWQYIVSGVMEPRFQKVLGSVVSAAQMQRIQTALAPLVHAVPQSLSGSAPIVRQ